MWRGENEREKGREGRVSGAGCALVSAADLGVEVGCLQPLCKGFCALFGAQEEKLYIYVRAILLYLSSN